MFEPPPPTPTLTLKGPFFVCEVKEKKKINLDLTPKFNTVEES